MSAWYRHAVNVAITITISNMHPAGKFDQPVNRLKAACYQQPECLLKYMLDHIYV